MSENKINASLGLGTAAILLSGASLAYTSSQIGGVNERVDCCDSDIKKLAIELKKLQSVVSENN